MIKIDKLFFKILLPVWIAFSILFITASIMLKQIKTPFSMTIIEKILINTYSDSASAIYQYSGKKGVEEWAKELSLKKNIKFSLSQSQTPNKVGAYKSENFIIGPNLINDKNKKTLRLIANRDELTNEYINALPTTTVRLTVALFLAFVLCVALTNMIYKNIRIIRRSVANIKKGNFDCISKTKNKSDEISLLYNEVFAMSKTISELIQSKNRLLQDISHEFRSPLARQLTAIAITKKKYKDISEEDLQRIEDENIKLEQLVSELLEYSKSNRTKTLVPEPVELVHVIDEIIDKTNFEFQTNCIRLESSISISVEADPGLLYRALENILRNSIKYAGITKEILVTLENRDSDIAIHIKDRGPGVSEDELNIMFQPFQRLGNHQSKKGYGLGLAIAKEIIDMHQGRISATNRKNGGLTITIIIPKKTNSGQ